MTTEPAATAGDRVITPLREARESVHRGLRQLQVAARALDEAEERVARASLDAALAYLKDEFLPACNAEEFTILIAVNGCLGSPGATDPMRAQHAALRSMADDLEKVVEASRERDLAGLAPLLRPLLYGLYAAARVHLESEDDAYLPLLDEHLSESQVGMVTDNYGRIMAGSAPPDRPPAIP